MPKKNVLVVDDSPFIREMVCKILDKLGFLSVKASDGDEALVIADRYTPDAFVLDVNMPKMNGLQVLSKLREDERFKDTPSSCSRASRTRTSSRAASAAKPRGTS